MGTMADVRLPEPASAVDGVTVFDEQRRRLVGLAYRMLGSLADAEDVVQEVWLRWQRSDISSIEQPQAWLTTVTTRVALDRSRAQMRRREDYPGPWLPEPLVQDGPEEAAELADSLTLGFLVLLDALAPLERAVFILADVFGTPYREIAGAVGKPEGACRQIASRARAKVRAAPPPPAKSVEQRQTVDALLGALAAGDAEALLAVLSPDVVLVSDGGPTRRAARRRERWRHSAWRPARSNGPQRYRRCRSEPSPYPTTWSSPRCITASCSPLTRTPARSSPECNCPPRRTRPSPSPATR